MERVLAALTAILDEEAKYEPDWSLIKVMSDDTIAHINRDNIVSSVPADIYQFLDDYDVRNKDDKYAMWQREKVLRYLRESPGVNN